MNLLEKKIDSQRVFSGRIMNVDVDRVSLPDGKEAVRECVRHSGGAAVLLVKDESVLLVKQFRYLYNKEIYEIPAGKLNEGEDPLVAAARELEEETGFKANLFHALDIYPTPGYTDEIIHIYFAKNYEYVGCHLDEGEFLNCEFIPIKNVLEMVDSGEIADAKTIAALYKYLLNEKG
jgi:ADP-ribose pyrophosphatase